ncbi:amino acid transporter [Glonium stellatum]|uniref:Amino acid transporter n=1 Tax=Glonium stellatum TaxID=574774 RepID=A0A8E2ENU3_9PEZI|nr:amino acid transporter [Glonium stellatum]
MSSSYGNRSLEEPTYNSSACDNVQEQDLLGVPHVDNSDAALDHPATRRISTPARSLTYLNGLALVVGLQIGAGIFSAPSVVRAHVSSPTIALFVWLLAGVLVWTGASSFIELGTRVPRNGGIQEYLRHCYGELYGFLFAWVWLLVSRPCAMAMVAFIFSEYIFKALLPDQDVSNWALKVTAILAILLMTYLNCMGTKSGTGAASFFLILKVVGLGSIAIIGFAFVATGLTHQDGNNQADTADYGLFDPPPPAESSLAYSWFWMSLGGFTDAVLAALFAYAGWESISFVIGEMEEPHSTLPRVLNNSMALVITLFLASNFALYTILSLKTLQETNAIALAFGSRTLGRAGALFYAWIVCLSCLGALNAIVFSSGRLTQAAGARRYLPSFFKTATHDISHDQRSNRNRGGTKALFRRTCPSINHGENQNVPINAMMLNATVGAVYVLTGSFRGLLSFKGMVEYVIYFITVFGLLLVRFRPSPQNDEALSGIYITPIFNPLIFCFVAALIVLRSAISHWLQATAALLVFGLGSLLYYSSWWEKLVSPAMTVETG